VCVDWPGLIENSNAIAVEIGRGAPQARVHDAFESDLSHMLARFNLVDTRERKPWIVIF